MFKREFTNNVVAFSPQFIAARSGFGSSSRQPIFIVGMPRSGTTLAESICAAHSKVGAADELPFLSSLASQLGAQRDNEKVLRNSISRMKQSDVTRFAESYICLLYTSDAADDLLCVD